MEYIKTSSDANKLVIRLLENDAVDGKRLSSRKLAERCGVSKQTVNDIVNLRNDMRISTLLAILEYFKYSLVIVEQ